MGNKKLSGRKKKRMFSGIVTKQKIQDGGKDLVNSQSSSSDLNTSASKRKLSDVVPDVENHSECLREGYILMDVSILCEYLSRTAVCNECETPVQCGINLDDSQGFAHNFVSYCENCDSKTILFNSSKKTERTEIVKGKKTPFEVNSRMVSFVRGIGKGHTALEIFSKHLNSPPPMTAANYGKLFKRQHAASKAVATESMKAAAQDVLKEGRDCAVSFDGTWQRRGHASHHGVISAISVDTGKCLDVEVLSNICKGCQHWEKADKTSDKYLRWKADHKCSSNHVGSAGAMESVGALRIFTRSETTRNLRYTKYLGDGDSSSFKTVSESKPYEDVDIEKLECVGHIQKRVGTRLRNLRKDYKGKKLSDSKGISGAGRLTIQRIDTLQNFYGMAIRQNKGELVPMQRAVLASLYHVASTDSNPQHGMCPTDSWCKFNNDPENYKHKHGLAEAIVELLEPIYDELSDPSLLVKCLHGKTQNNNECLNKLIWDRCSKEVFVGNQTIEDAAYCAVAQFNDGNVSIMKHFEKLGITSGRFTSSGVAVANVKRIYWSDKKSSDGAKKRRKHLRSVKKGYQDKNEQKEGNVYESGAH